MVLGCGSVLCPSRRTHDRRLEVGSKAPADGPAFDFDEIAAPQLAPRRERGRGFGAGRNDELPEPAVVDDDADVRTLVDMRDDTPDAHRIAARALVLRQRADCPDGREGWQIAGRCLPALRCRQGPSHGQQREDNDRKEGPASHGRDTSAELRESEQGNAGRGPRPAARIPRVPRPRTAERGPRVL